MKIHISRNQVDTGDGAAACTGPHSRRSALIGDGLERSENDRAKGAWRRTTFAASDVEKPMSLPRIDMVVAWSAGATRPAVSS